MQPCEHMTSNNNLFQTTHTQHTYKEGSILTLILQDTR